MILFCLIKRWEIIDMNGLMVLTLEVTTNKDFKVNTGTISKD